VSVFLQYTPILKEVEVRHSKSMMKHLAFQLIKRDLVCKYFIEISASILSGIYSLGSIKMALFETCVENRVLIKNTV